jgi:hypothetical protein
MVVLLGIMTEPDLRKSAAAAASAPVITGSLILSSSGVKLYHAGPMSQS